MSATSIESTSLKSWERWLYGGLGAMAPLAVIGATTDTVAVFSTITLVVAIAWTVKCAILFAIGGFVAFLHKTEGDNWKCFLIGISAPALITTGLSGTAARINSPASNAELGFFSRAFAAPNPETEAAAKRIKVIPIAGLKEGVAEQIKRGLFGVDPPLSLVVVSAEASEAAARTVAAAVARYSECPTVTRNFKVARADHLFGRALRPLCRGGPVFRSQRGRRLLAHARPRDADARRRAGRPFHHAGESEPGAGEPDPRLSAVG